MTAMKMTAEDALGDLVDRLITANHRLDEVIAEHGPRGTEVPRLRGKQEGVMLALSYVQEMLR